MFRKNSACSGKILEMFRISKIWGRQVCERKLGKMAAGFSPGHLLSYAPYLSLSVSAYDQQFRNPVAALKVKN